MLAAVEDGGAEPEQDVACRARLRAVLISEGRAGRVAKDGHAPPTIMRQMPKVGPSAAMTAPSRDVPVQMSEMVLTPNLGAQGGRWHESVPDEVSATHTLDAASGGRGRAGRGARALIETHQSVAMPPTMGQTVLTTLDAESMMANWVSDGRPKVEGVGQSSLAGREPAR